MVLAGPVLVTARSARACTVVRAVELLLVALGSVVLLLVVAVLLSTVPSATLALTRAVTLNVAEAPAARVLINSLNWPLPTAGEKVGPDVWLSDTKVSPAGRVSPMITPWASLEPLLVSVIV